jgi:hypothetical protein
VRALFPFRRLFPSKTKGKGTSSSPSIPTPVRDDASSFQVELEPFGSGGKTGCRLDLGLGDLVRPLEGRRRLHEAGLRREELREGIATRQYELKIRQGHRAYVRERRERGEDGTNEFGFFPRLVRSFRREGGRGQLGTELLVLDVRHVRRTEIILGMM